MDKKQRGCKIMKLFETFQEVCMVCAISAVVLKLLSGMKWTDAIFKFLKRHRIIAILYLALTALGFVFCIINSL